MSDTAQRPIRILLLDDHALFRESVARLLASEPGFEVVGHCSSVEDSLAVLRKSEVDIVLLDLDLGHADGRDFLFVAQKEGFRGKVLVVTAGIDKGQVPELLRGGISGVFMKHESTALLVEGIHNVMAGRTWFQHDLLQATVSLDAPHSESYVQTFTNRERQVLSYLFEGLINKEIADRIGVSESAVKATIQQLFSKMGVRTRSQLVRIALEQYRDQI
jgi:two-component system, NarL family, nitrate/nitrite response regulator NarL